MPLIFKICPENLWRAAEDAGAFAGSPIDRADGFIHFSTAAQAAETAARHFSGQVDRSDGFIHFSTAAQAAETAALHFSGRADLVLVAVEAEALGDALRYEPSRGGALFPHLYGPLPLSAVRWVKPLRLGPDGGHRFPELA